MIKQQSVEVHTHDVLPYKLSTPQIKSELGDWPKEYRSHQTGSMQFDCQFLFGEKKGVVDWMVEDKILELSNGGRGLKYWHIINLGKWKCFERKLELMRELQLRWENAQKIQKEAERSLVDK